MSLDLTLVVNPPNWAFAADRVLAYTRFRIQNQEPGLQSALRSRAAPTGNPMLWYDDGGVRETRTDAYGGPLTAMYAGDIASIMAGYALEPWDLAIVAFLYALPSFTPVQLYWH